MVNCCSVYVYVYRVSKWLEEEPQRKKKLREEKRKRVMHRRTQPKHFFDDQGYMKQLRANEEEMDDALKQGVCVFAVPRFMYYMTHYVPYDIYIMYIYSTLYYRQSTVVLEIIA